MRRLALACLLLVVGCDRVPIDPDGTSLLVTSPDLGVVQLDSDFRLRLVPEGTTGPLTVRIEGTDIPFDSTAAAFIFERKLVQGVNSFELTVTGGTGTVQTDTLYAFYLPLQALPLVEANAGVARLDAAVTSLPTGQAIISGGRSASGGALPSADVLQSQPSRVIATTVPLRQARAGHTATLVEGGSLLLGGTNAAASAGSAAFVRSPEWVSPSGETRTVEILGGADGPARTGHVTRAVTFEGATYLYLFGGQSPAGSGAAATATFDIYRVEESGGFSFRLERLSPPGGVSGFVPLPDAALASTGPETAAVFGLGAEASSTFTLRWSTPGTPTSPFSVEVQPGAPLRTPRSAAATVGLGGGLSMVLGGRDADDDPVPTLEVYAASVNRAFRFPPELQLRVPRSDHIATIFGTNRIVVAGGRPASGSAITAYEAFQF